jgi:hypothetical protein
MKSADIALLHTGYVVKVFFFSHCNFEREIIMIRMWKKKFFHYVMYYDSSPRGRRHNERSDSSRRSREHRSSRRSHSRERGSQSRRHRFLLLLDVCCKEPKLSVFIG